jgi:hypothetical protein
MTFHIPSTTLFEEAATVPLTVMITAVLVTSFSAGIATAVEQIGGYAVGD